MWIFKKDKTEDKKIEELTHAINENKKATVSLMKSIENSTIIAIDKFGKELGVIK